MLSSKKLRLFKTILNTKEIQNMHPLSPLEKATVAWLASELGKSFPIPQAIVQWDTQNLEEFSED